MRSMVEGRERTSPAFGLFQWANSGQVRKYLVGAQGLEPWTR